jgi:hypothetical protein
MSGEEQSRVGSQGGLSGQRPHPQDLESLLPIVMKLPWWWVVPMGVLALITSFTVDHTDKGWDVHFQVTAITLDALALIWLPALLRLLLLTGARFKGAGIELASGGLFGALQLPIRSLHTR